MDFAQLITPLLYRLPLFLLWLIGTVIAIIRWKRHPRVSLLAIIGFLVLSFSTFFTALLPPLTGQMMRDFLDYRLLLNVLLPVMRLLPFLDALGWIFVLPAIFNGRNPVMQSETIKA
jgi:hypothetical protein